jgi:rhamnosyltransferase
MSKSSNKYISVFIPTYNGDKYITEILDAILKQQLPDGYKLEILVTDSGSADKTVEIIQNNYSDEVNLDQIPNNEFGHGKTRQRAAERAKGEIVMFLSQDATPTSSLWLINMLEPFFVSPLVSCTFGRQIPRPTAPVTIKREVATVFGSLGSPDAITLHRHRSLVNGSKMNEINTFFSDVNSAVRRKQLLRVPFRDVKYAEDQALAEDMQNAGLLKAYSVAGSVWHSNEYTIGEYRKRKFDEFVGLQNSVNYVIKAPLKTLLLGWLRPTLADWKFMRYDSEYSRKRKLLNLFLSPCYNIANVAGRYDAYKYGDNPSKHHRYSLETSRK